MYINDDDMETNLDDTGPTAWFQDIRGEVCDMEPCNHKPRTIQMMRLTEAPHARLHWPLVVMVIDRHSPL